uniref:Si:dkey-82o10.4 n=1 Tax=Gasterosteus aculeatus aculeatus TaxID=481459 RepID=G3PHX6_GASAC
MSGVVASHRRWISPRPRVLPQVPNAIARFSFKATDLPAQLLHKKHRLCVEFRGRGGRGPVCSTSRYEALVHVSGLLSSGKYHNLVGIVSSETIDYVQMRCGSLSEARRRQLAVTMDDIVFALPEDVSVVFDKHGRQFCDVAMRFWLLSTYEGPDDPEGTKIFQVAPSGDGGPQRRIVTAVYEFHRELTRGASPDWTVTTVWHWHWEAAE